MSEAADLLPDWNALGPHLDRALELEGAEREAWLEDLTSTQPEVAREVRKLLARHELLDSQGFLSQSPVGIAPRDGRAGTRVGAYTIERLLGRGGMGEVWLATRTDGRFEGKCAIKFVDEAAASAKFAERFRREAHVLARLAHQNIARLLDAGTNENGTPYLVLEFVDGERIDRYCESHAFDVEARVKLFVAVVAAVAHAHSQLIVHRDLKPSNVLVTADGQVKLLDFGIAKLLSPESTAEGATRLEDSALTPEYAAPEQLLGEMPSTATDVYQLGLLLYELLAHRLPRSISGSRAEKIRAALDGVIPQASAVAAPADAKRLRGDLDAILSKALRGNPAERYSTAQAFQDELIRYLRREPVEARRGAVWYRAHRFMRRHAVALGATVAIVVTVLVGATLAWHEKNVARREAQKAEAVQAFLTDVFLANRSDQPDPLRAQKTTARELLLNGSQRIKSSLDDAPEAKAAVLKTLGSLMQDLGLADQAVQLHKDRIALLRKQGADNASLAEALLTLADAMGTSSSLDERDAVLTEAKRIIDADPSLAPTMHAELYFQLAEVEQYRDWSRSADFARQATVLFRRHGPAARAAESLRLEADAAFELNQLEAAETALTDSAAIARGLKQDRNRVLPGVELALAEVQANRLKIDAADASYRRAVQEAARVYGREHSNYLDAIFGYAAFLGQNARIAEALVLLREAVATNARVNGPDEGYFTPNYESVLGVMLVEYGQPEEAAPLFEHALRVKRNAVRDNLSLAAFLHLATRAPQELGDAQAAIARLDEARDIIAKHDAESGQDLLRTNQIERARLALRFNRPAEALRLLALAGINPGPVPEDRREIRYHLLLAESLAHNRDLKAAAQASATIRALIERLGLQQAARQDLARLDVIDAMVSLAASDTGTASLLFRRALQSRRALLHPRSTLIAEAMIGLARSLQHTDGRETKELLLGASKILASHPHVSPQFASPAF